MTNLNRNFGVPVLSGDTAYWQPSLSGMAADFSGLVFLK